MTEGVYLVTAVDGLDDDDLQGRTMLEQERRESVQTSVVWSSQAWQNRRNSPHFPRSVGYD